MKPHTTHYEESNQAGHAGGVDDRLDVVKVWDLCPEAVEKPLLVHPHDEVPVLVINVLNSCLVDVLADHTARLSEPSSLPNVSTVVLIQAST